MSYPQHVNSREPADAQSFAAADPTAGAHPSPDALPEPTAGGLVRRRRRRKTSWLKRVTRRPRRFVRRHKALTVVVAMALILALILLVWLWFLDRKLDDVPRFDVDMGQSRPAVGLGTTILVAGVDDGKGTRLAEAASAPEWPKGVFRSDAIMLVHLSEDGSTAQVVSIPRDSYVPVEGYGRTKINAAFSFGGPELLARTVESFTKIRVDHVMVTDFDGFKGITEVVGGVMVHIPQESLLPGSPFRAGWQRIQGDDALAYVRQRYGLPGGDFDRAQRQQNVLRQIVDRATDWSVLANPVSLTRLVEEITSYLAVDATLTNAKLRELAFTARNLRTHDVEFATIPHEGSATIDGASVVKVVPRDVRALFAAIARDDFATYVLQHEVDRLPAPQQVK